MSYLNIPRLHFTGKFQADPSTLDNNDANWDPNIQLSNDPNAVGWVYWNPNGTHNWKLLDCTVRGAANDQGQFTAPSSDPIIGARVLSSGQYPAKLVDLDPDNQCVSQIWGLEVQVSIADPTDPTKVLASVTGTLSTVVDGVPVAAAAFGDLWSRCANIPYTGAGMGTMCASFHGVLTGVVWANASVSPLLAALQSISPDTLSILFNLDSYQSDSNQSNFTFGRVVGTIGPALTGDAPRSTPRRLAPVTFSTPPPAPPSTPSIFSSYGPAGSAWDDQRGVLILDLGNCIPTDGTPPASGPSVPDLGWPIPTATLQLTIPGPSVSPNVRFAGLKSGLPFRAAAGAPTVVGAPFQFSLETYLTYAGIVELSVSSPSVVSLLQTQPLTLTDVTNSQMPVVAAQEDAQGRYVDVDVPFLRLNAKDVTQVTLWATQFGQPWNGASLQVQLQAPAAAANGNPIPLNPPPPVTWKNSDPQGALCLNATTDPQDASCLNATNLTTGPDGTAILQLTAHDPGTPRTYPDKQPGPDGQIYWITGPWAAWGQIFLYPGAPINILVFSSYAMPAQPNWDEHVGPILSHFAHMYPYMKGIIDLGDYPTVQQNAGAIKHVLNLSINDPHYMPVVRDLSPDKLAMINQWFENGMPKSSSVPIKRD
ncbi:MAG TPA: hypothetical protein VEX43_19450 [Chthoniobacterales bacterium]|nr:hypothetical protein [Chthoniobacterales bacterium]